MLIVFIPTYSLRWPPDWRLLSGNFGPDHGCPPRAMVKSSLSMRSSARAVRGLWLAKAMTGTASLSSSHSKRTWCRGASVSSVRRKPANGLSPNRAFLWMNEPW